MTSDVNELVERLRAMNLACCDDAAFVLEAQAEEIERLTAGRGAAERRADGNHIGWSRADSHRQAVERERDALKAEVERLRAAARNYFKLRADWDHMVRYGRDPGEDAEVTLDAVWAELDAALNYKGGSDE